GDQASFNRTIAHELGHGAFAYEHPFDNAAYKTEQGTTHNLMDYVKDDDLAYFQWQSTLGLNLTWGFLEGDEEGLFLGFQRDFTWLGDWAEGFGNTFNEDEEEMAIENQMSLFLTAEENISELGPYIRGVETVSTLKNKDGSLSFKAYEEAMGDYWGAGSEVLDFFLDKNSTNLPFDKNTFVRNYTGILPPNHSSVVLFSFKDKPTISNYRISKLEDMRSPSSRVKAGFCFKKEKDEEGKEKERSFGIISFYAPDHSIDAVLLIEMHEKSNFEKAEAEFKKWVDLILMKHDSQNDAKSEFEWLSSYSNSKTTQWQIVNQRDFFVAYDKAVRSGAERTILRNEFINENFTVFNYYEKNNNSLIMKLDALHALNSVENDFIKYGSGFCSYSCSTGSYQTPATNIGIIMYANAPKKIVLDKTIDACLYHPKNGGQSFGLISFSSVTDVDYIMYIDVKTKQDLEKWIEYFFVKDDANMSISILNPQTLHPHDVDDNPSCIRPIYGQKGRNITGDNFQFLYVKPNKTYNLDLSVKGSNINLNDLKISLEHCGSPAKITATQSVNQSKKTIALSVKSGNFTEWQDKSHVPCISLSQGNEVLYKLYVVPCERRVYNLHVRVLNGKDKNGVITNCKEFNYKKFQDSINEIYNPINIYFKYDSNVETISDYEFKVEIGKIFNPGKYFNVYESNYSALIVPGDYILNNGFRNAAGYAPVNHDYPKMNGSGNSSVFGGTAAAIKSNYSSDHTSAHELGHLIFGLEHPFDRKSEMPLYKEGEDNRNVMDYGDPSVKDAIIRAYDVLHINGFSGY
ncbi:MAG: hypothetical protein IKX43_01735, partial [Paludibacteraceae bacterium]|nr:hypothetical protein [Paludibacteraceae bacterium]